MNPAPICQDFLPLKPKRLISLWDMLQFRIRELIGALTLISQREETIKEHWPQDKQGQESALKAIIEIVQKMQRCAEFLELNETLGRCDQFLQSLDFATDPFQFAGIEMRLDRFTAPELSRELKGIGDAVAKELYSKKFVFIPPNKVKFLERDDLFGKDVLNAFPSASQEIKEAGNCIAADLNTAAIFHLMRTVEMAMRVLITHLKIKIKNKAIKESGWDELIRLIDKKLKERREKYDKSSRKKRADWLDLKYYGVIADELNVFKENWRDKVMHSWCPYNEHDAQTVFVRVKDFMQKLSEKVKENN